MANEPQILGSDVDVLEAIAAGGATSASPTTTTSAVSSKDDPDFPVAPVWPDQDGAGAHTNCPASGS